MLMYGGDELIPVGYTDSNFMSDKDSRKSTSGHLFTLGGGVVSWRSIKHKCIADSTTEAEYVVLGNQLPVSVRSGRNKYCLKISCKMDLLLV